VIESITYNNSRIHFGSLEDNGFNDVLKNSYPGSKKIIITDGNVHGFWIEQFVTSFSELNDAEIIQIPAGEENKTLEVCHQIWEAFSDYQISRNDLIINFGGGVITDLGGFVASLFKRGLPFINVPTTLLSQVDASVGGKTGVDLGPFKNQIGVFADADHVFIDDSFLTTLPSEELFSGYAEMLKHGLISDKSYWSSLKSFDPINNTERLKTIHTSVCIKKNIVEQDHKESGLRKILNYGHTIGHGIEGYLLKSGQPTYHGYAVAWGIIAESYICHKLDLISSEELNEIVSTVYLKYPHLDSSSIDIEEVLELMKNDKKNKEGNIQFSLIEGIGKGLFDIAVDEKLIRESIAYLLN
jgi:3-dehydroquinate synthase